MEEIQTVEFKDSEYETTYTAHVQRSGSGWIGWIQEHPQGDVSRGDKGSVAENS